MPTAPPAESWQAGLAPGVARSTGGSKPSAIAALRQLAEAAPAASFVISSSWRVHGLPTISRLLTVNGCQDFAAPAASGLGNPCPVESGHRLGSDTRNRRLAERSRRERSRRP